MAPSVHERKDDTDNDSVQKVAHDVEKTIVDGIEGKDDPIGDHTPSAPFAIVFGAYPIALIIVLALALAFSAWWFRT